MYLPWSLDQLVKEYERTSSGHFFSDGNMRFFKTRLIHSLFFRDSTEKCVYFVTSEKKCFSDPTRVFSLRKAFLKEDKKYQIETVKGFFGVSRYKCQKEMERIKNARIPNLYI